MTNARKNTASGDMKTIRVKQAEKFNAIEGVELLGSIVTVLDQAGRDNISGDAKRARVIASLRKKATA